MPKTKYIPDEQEYRQVLCLCTSHVRDKFEERMKAEEEMLMSKHCIGAVVMTGQYGWMLWFTEDVMQQGLSPDDVGAILSSQVSDLLPLAELAHALRIQYLWFDADAGEVEGLPCYVWELGVTMVRAVTDE